MVSDPYGSIDANIVQLRGLLKSAGRDIVKDRDWTHLIKEYSFVTRQTWATGTVYTFAAAAWGQNTAYSVTNLVKNHGNLYRCTTAGTSAAIGFGEWGPHGTGSSITDGTCVWKYQNAGAASIVVSGNFYYTCVLQGGTSGTVAPFSDVFDFTSQVFDGTSIIWQCTGYASDYALPADFSNLIDQTGWNRTNQLPVGGPVDGRMWQYLKGRQQGVVFNVLFRPVAGLMRLYPDTDTPGGYQIVFEYASTSWVGSASSTAPTTDAPAVNSDIIYFDSMMMLRRVKLDWLKAKGFDTTHAQREYDDSEEAAQNADGASPVLNLAGRGPWGPLVGAQNVPWTGFGS